MLALQRVNILMRKIPLQMQLVLVVSAAILPLAMLCGLAIQALFQSQYAQNEASSRGIARAMATAVDAELRLTVSALQTLALTEPFSEPNGLGQAGAMALSRTVRTSHLEWRGILLATPSGHVVFSVDGNAKPGSQVVDRTSLDDAVRTKQPTVGPLSRGVKGNFAFPIRVPVIRDGVVHHVLTAIVGPESIAAVLQAQRIPPEWNVSVFDANLVRIARAVDDEKWRGGPPSDSLRSMLNDLGNRREMVGATVNVDGHHAQTVIARLDAAPWTLVLGASTAASEGSWMQTMRTYLMGLLASLGLGGMGAWWMSRAITGPMRRLRDDADAIGRGEQRPAAASGITEIDAVARALEAAAVQRAASEAGREQLLALESKARTAAEAAEQRLQHLLSASAQLSRSLEEGSTLSAIARVIVPNVADLCHIDLFDRSGQLERKLTHHFDPVRGAQIDDLMSNHFVSGDAPGSFPWAIRTGQSFLYNIGHPDEPEITDPGLREFVRRLDIRATCVVPLVARGRTIGAIAVLQVESQRRFSPEDSALIGELAQRAALALDNVLLLTQAREAQEEAEAANRAKDEFLAMLGHELRNPLAPIALAVRLMERRDAQAFPKEREIISRQVKHLSLMVDDLLDVSRIISGKIVMSRQQVDLRDVVGRALELTAPAMQSRSAAPEVDMPAAPVFIKGDILRLVQIVCNLLNNAVKFSPAETLIRVALRVEDARAVLSVVDYGMGITPSLLPQVFKRFVQGEQALQRAAGGLGLGLAIAQSLAKLHNGDIEARSAGTGQGSTFIVRLPLSTDAAPVTPEKESAVSSQRSLRLLLVDDNKDALHVLADWFRMEGHHVRTAYSSEEALERLAADSGDAAIFDIGLPGISGYELARMVRSNVQTQDIALVALTGYGRESDRQHALNAGFDAHFAKPADPNRMLERINAILDSRTHVKSAGVAN